MVAKSQRKLSAAIGCVNLFTFVRHFKYIVILNNDIIILKSLYSKIYLSLIDDAIRSDYSAIERDRRLVCFMQRYCKKRIESLSIVSN